SICSCEISVTSVLQSAEVSNERLDVRISELLGEGRHFTFDAAFDDGGDPGIALDQAVKVGSLVPTRIVSMAGSAIVVEQPGTLFRLSLQGGFRADRAGVRRLFPPRICGLAWLQERRQSEGQPEQTQRGHQSQERSF